MGVLPQGHLLATKMMMPRPARLLIPRPRLIATLAEGRQGKLTLISAPAGFGKTTLVSAWINELRDASADESLHVNQKLVLEGSKIVNPHVAWLSLDEGDNDPIRFWRYLFTAIEQVLPGASEPALLALQAQQLPVLDYVLTLFINGLTATSASLVVVLDDYHLIKEPALHRALTFLLENQPPHLHLLLLTRVDPPLPLAALRANAQVQELRAEQLRCTTAEVDAFFRTVMDMQLSPDVLHTVTTRTEGWLVGLRLTGLWLQRQGDPADVVHELRGSHRYILDYLTEQVLQRQSEAVRAFLVRTSILERFCAPLCDAMLESDQSQALLEQLEQANLFVEPLDGERRWYRYHALFAEALRHHLPQIDETLIPQLRLRASHWYEQQGQLHEAVQQALLAGAWERSAALIDQIQFSYVREERHHEQLSLHRWLEQLPPALVRSRARLALSYAQILSGVAPIATVQEWLKIAEQAAAAALNDDRSLHQRAVTSAEEENLLGEILAFRAHFDLNRGNLQHVLALCQQAHTHLSPQNKKIRSSLAFTEGMAHAVLGNADQATQKYLQAAEQALTCGEEATALIAFSTAARSLQVAGRLPDSLRLTNRAIAVGTRPYRTPSLCWIYERRADLRREWNQLDEALADITHALELNQIHPGVTLSVVFSANGNRTLCAIQRSRGDLAAARAALALAEEAEQVRDRPSFAALQFVIERVQLWLACGELPKAVAWAAEVAQRPHTNFPMGAERETITRARVLLAQKQPEMALPLLSSVLTAGPMENRKNDYLEALVLQVVAYQLRAERTQALDLLAEAVRLAVPAGYIRRFVDEGEVMRDLLCDLRLRLADDHTAHYVDQLLAAFASQQTDQPSGNQSLIEPLSERELQVLRLLAQGASNQAIATSLVVTQNTVKNHVSNIMGKLQASNRTHAVAQARELGLLDS